jgi:hypothetical protein
VDPLLDVVVVVAGVVKFDPAPPQPVIANESTVQKQMLSREIWFKSRLPKKGESTGFSYPAHSAGRSKSTRNRLVEKN